MGLMEGFIKACRNSWEKDLASWEHDIQIMRKGLEEDRISWERDKMQLKEFREYLFHAFHDSKKTSNQFMHDMEHQGVCKLGKGTGTIEFKRTIEPPA